LNVGSEMLTLVSLM